LCIVTAAYGQTSIQQLFAFQCTSTKCPDGEQPDAVIQASDGNFYGVAQASIPGGGTIFKLTASGKVTQLFRFPNNTQTGFFDDGNAPNSIAEGSDGLLYGTAGSGGPNSASLGTLWRIHKDGTDFQVLQQFCTSCTNGGSPNNIIAGSNGNLYGTTGYGGFFPSSGGCQGLGCGVIFRLTTSGVYTVLHRFNGTTETSLPIGVTQASDGNLYGGTGYLGGGALYRVTPSGKFTNLFTFGSGVYALAPLTQASDGLLYGFSHLVNASTIELFSSTLEGSVDDIASVAQALFKQYGIGKLLQATDGNFWTSASVAPGGSGFGRVFAITAAGTIVDSLSFSGTNGSFPTNGLIQAISGVLYGTTIKGGTTSNGTSGSGVIYTISGLPPK
jgi:hypothetical protein